MELLKKNVDKYSWIIAPKWLHDAIKSTKFERELKLYFLDIEHIYLGNYNSCTLLRMEQWYHFIQNDKIKKIEINQSSKFAIAFDLNVDIASKNLNGYL